MTFALRVASPAHVRSGHARQPLRTMVVVAVLSLVALSLPGHVGSAHAKPSAPTHEDTAGILIRRINAERAKAGLRPLELDHDLAEEAMRWSERMAERGHLKHAPGRVPDGATALRENIGYSGRDEAGAHLHAMLMGSARHRAAILDPQMTTFGIGVVEHRGRTWVTQRFTNAPVPR